MRLVWFSLFVFIHSVICINESDVQRRYSVNHPPSAEDYNPIPVSVVYEDDVIGLKSHIPKYYDISHDRDVKKESTTEGSQPVAPKKNQEIEPIIYKNKTESETEDILVRPTARSLSEFQIPVAVIYDSPPDNTQNLRAIDQEETNPRRRIYKRVSRRKPLQNNTAENENFTNHSPQIDNKGSGESEIQKTKPVKPQLSRAESAKPQKENDDFVKSETPRTKPVKPQLSRTKSAKPQIENYDFIKSENPRAKPVQLQLSRTESAKSQIGNDDFVKSETPKTKPIKPQLSRTKSAKPQIENDDFVKSETPRTKPVKPQLSRTESAKSQIENDDFVKSETSRTKLDKPQLSRTESTKPRIENRDSVKSDTRRTQPVKPQLSRTESTKPPIEIEDFVKSDTRSKKPVKPQLSRSESVKPRRIVSARPSLSNIETTSKGEKTKRVRDPVVPIVEMENYVYAHNGNFHYSYEGGDGTKAHSEGQLRSIDEVAGEVVSGGFSYTDKDGNDFSLSYTADEHGYRPIGAHLPTPPPIPPAIAHALAYLATATTPEPVTKPSVKPKETSL